MKDIDLQTLSKTELIERNQYLETMINLSPDILYIYDIIENKNIYSNNVIERILGFSTQEILDFGSQIIPALMHPDDLETYKNETLPSYATAQDKEVLITEYRMKHKNGSWRWLKSNETIYLRNSDGSPKQIFGMIQDITQQKDSEEALLNSEGLLNATQLLSKAGGWEWDVDKNTMTWTDETYRIHDMKREDFPDGLTEHIEIGISCYRVEDQPIISDSFEKCVSQGVPYDNIFPFTTTKGRELWIRTTAKAEKTNGKVTKVIGIIMDITIQKQLEDALKENELRYYELFQNMSSSVAVYNAVDDGNDFEFVDFNKSAEKLDKLKKEDVIGQKVTKLFPGVESAEIFNIFKRVWNTGKSEHCPIFFYKNEKIEGWRDNFVYKLPSGNIIAIYDDVTERKQTEMSLVTEKERLAVTLSSIHDGVITTDSNGNITMLNKSAELLTGWNTNEAAGKPLPDVFNIINGLTRKPLANPYDEVITNRKNVKLANQTCLITKDGQEIEIAESIAPIHDKESKILGVVLVFRDMTEKKKLDESREKSQKLESLGLLAGGIAHDFNNLLGGMFGYVEMAKNSIENNQLEEAHKALVKSFNVFERTKGLTQQLLTFASGGAPILKTTNFQDLIIKNIKLSLSGTNVTQKLLIDKNLWLCDCDEKQIIQVFDNIVINAQQAMPEGGIITVFAKNENISKTESTMAHKTGDYIKISIQDQGIGIAQKHISKIFDPFFTTKSMGSGLGLATVYSIVNRHGGWIDVESIQGKGTTFNIFLPASQLALNSKKNTNRDKHSSVGTVLIMDDEEIIRETVGAMIITMGYKVIFAKDGQEALTLFTKAQATEQLVLTILDLTIPYGMGGKDTIKAIRKMDDKALVIVASGYADDPVMINPIEYGFTAKIAKPFRKSQLEELLDMHVKKAEY